MVKRLIVNLGLLGILTIVTTSARAATNLPVVDSAALGNRRNLPWSEVVQINDPFEGNFIGVFDRHYFNERFLNTRTQIEVQSLWSREFVRFLLMIRDRDCLSGSFPNNYSSGTNCSALNNTKNIIEMLIKINDEVLQVTGQNSTFIISDEFAQALQNAPKTTISIRLVTQSGETIDSEIGQETVEAWKTLYTSQASTAQQK
ncbi:MAG: hypothetical protein F6K26_43830 [Moorea sp. SIO2I5]|nr:hypothetical protein [Moorena sp. SIO2I5]